MPAILLPANIVILALLLCRGVPVRVAVLRALVVVAAILCLMTEVASLFNGLTAPVLVAGWTATLVAGVVLVIRRSCQQGIRFHLSGIEICGIAAIAVILIPVGYTALLSPPNSADAMSYHLPRVLQWIQNQNVRFFPTGYLNLIMMQPLAEYVMLHLYLLSGGDALTNLVQFAGFAGSIAAASAIAQQCGLSRRAQVIAALFCATLPNGILQASGAKNDCLLSLWLAGSVLFTIRWLQERSIADLACLSLAAALALATKGTAYLFLPAFLVGAALWTGRLRSLQVRDLAVLAAGILLVNGPQYWRNYDLSGSPLGFDSSHADGAFRWRNEHLGWKATISNAVRNLSEQLGARSETWNQAVFSTALSVHARLGIDPQDTATTWRWTEYRPPRNSNHEADANNRWHLLLIVTAVGFALWSGERRWLLYAIAPAGGFLAFCFYLKWQLYFSRLQLPLFVIAAPLAAMAIARIRPAVLQVLICLALLANCRLAVTENWTRPLTGPRNLRNTVREQNYFNDMVQWNNRDSYMTAVERVAGTACRTVGLDNFLNHVEYPFQTLLLAQHPDTKFVYVNVRNPSWKYERTGGEPCAVLCIDCAGDGERIRDLSHFGASETIGRFVLFLR